MGTIVLGVDGSAESKEALRWALEEARLRGSRLCVVHAWTLPAAVYGPGFGTNLVSELLEELQRGSEALIDRALEEAADPGGAGVARAAVEGPPAQTLVDAAADAELLVVGSRGHGGFAGLLLGSVSQQCAQHAPCPVVIVRSAPAGG